VPVFVFREQGLFEDGLFIDAVDFEFSLRVRSRGFHIEECSKAVLLHSPGTPKTYRFRGHHLFQTTNYSPVRRYYQARNNIWMVRHYWTRFPSFCFIRSFDIAKDYVKILIAEDRKWNKLRAAWEGTLDGVAGRMGRKDEI
jgi:rhamnosyltransferase